MSYFEEFRIKGKGTGAFYPESLYPIIEPGIEEDAYSNFDSAGNLAIRGSISTDEGSFRDSFVGTSLSRPITGTLTFTSGSTTVTGSGTSFTTSKINVFKSDYIKLDADSTYYRVIKIIDDTTLIIDSPYAGTTASGAASFRKYYTKTDAGTSISVANSKCVLTSGTTANSEVALMKEIDYCPLIMSIKVSLSQRIANQIGYVGMVEAGDHAIDPSNSTWFEFTGTSNTQVVCKSSLDTGVESTTIALPSGMSTDQELRYRIEVSQEYVQFSIEGVIVATHYNLIPDPYAVLNLHHAILNGATPPASSTTMSIDTVFISNANILQIQSGYTGIPLRVESAPTSRLPQSSANALDQYVIPSMNVLNYKCITAQFSGTWVGRLEFQASVDNINFHAVGAVNLNSDSFVTYTTSNGIFQVPNSGFYYFRVKVVGYTSGTVYADVTLNNSPLPIPSSSPLVSMYDRQNNKEIQFSNNREMRITNTVRLVGKLFEGTTLDSNYWAQTLVSGGTGTLGGGCISLKTSTGSSDSAKIATISVARFMSSANNVFKAVARFVTAGATNNVRRIGVFTSNISDGYFFEISGTTFRIGAINTNSVVTVSSNYNGNLGSTYTLDTNYHSFEILYGGSNADFFIDGKLLHSLKPTTAPLVSTLNFFAIAYNTNSGAVSGAPQLDLINMFITRLGELTSQARYNYISANGTYTLKLGSGILHKLLVTDNVGSITIYDNTAGSGTTIASFDATAFGGEIAFKAPFNIGLTVVTTGNAKLTVVYE
jgi:hypothetical protein